MAARGARIVAISNDSVGASKKFAQDYDIEFPLLEDADQSIAKKYAGVSTDGFSYPAVYLLREDGSVYFKRIGDSKDQRVFASELLEILDSLVQKEGMPEAAELRYDWLLSSAFGAGAYFSDGDSGFAADLEISALRKIGDYLALGIRVGGSYSSPQSTGRLQLLPRFNLPYWNGVGTAYLQLPLGGSLLSEGDTGVNLSGGAAIGNLLHWSPRFFLVSELGLDSIWADDEIGQSTVTFRLGAGYSF